MKKKYIIPGLLAAVAAVGLTSCDKDEQSLLSDLEVTGYTQEFKVGDQFSKGDLKVEAKYSDDKVVDVTNDIEIKAPESLSAPGTYAVIISYGGLSEAYQITVKDSSSTPSTPDTPVTPVTLKELTVSGAKNSFITGEAFASTGLKVEAKYSDDNVVDVTEDAEIKAPESISAPGTYAVVVSYGGLSTSYQVTVANEVITVADAIKLGVANVDKINGGVVTSVLGMEEQSGSYSLDEYHQAYSIGENYLMVKDYSNLYGIYSNIYHYFLASNDNVYAVSEYYDPATQKYVLESMDTSAIGGDALNGIALEGFDGEAVYGATAYVKALYELASENGNGDFKETVDKGIYSFEAGMYDKEEGFFGKAKVSFELSSEKTFKNIEILLTMWDDVNDFEEDATTHHYSLTDKAAIHGAYFQQYVFDETIGAKDSETHYVAENFISDSFTVKDSKDAEVADGATIAGEINGDIVLSYTSANKLVSLIADKPRLDYDFSKMNAYYSDPTQDGPILNGSVDDTVKGKLTFNDWNGGQTVFTILENGDLKDAEDHLYIKQDKTNQSVYDTYIYTLDDGRYVKFNYPDPILSDPTLAYSGDGKIYIRTNYSGTHTLKIETILDEITITINVPYQKPDSMEVKEFIPNEDNPNQATYAEVESSTMKSLVNDSLYFVGVPKFGDNANNASPTEFTAEIVSANKADATLELVDCEYQDGKIKAYHFTSAKAGTYEVKITSTVEGCEEVATWLIIEVVDVSNVQLTELVSGYYEGHHNMLPSFHIDFKPASSDPLTGVAYVAFKTYDQVNNTYATTYDYVIDADAKTVKLTENGDKKAAPLTFNLNKFMEMSLSLEYGITQYSISLSRSAAPDISEYYTDYKNAKTKDTISISADGVTATLGGQDHATTSVIAVGNYLFVDFETVSLVLSCESGMVTDSVYGVFAEVVDPLAKYFGTYADDDETLTLKLSKNECIFNDTPCQIKLFEGNALILTDAISDFTFIIRDEDIFYVKDEKLLVKQSPLKEYFGTYTNDNAGSILTISADGIVYDGYTFNFLKIENNAIIIVDPADPTFIWTLEIKNNGLYHTENNTELVKQDPLEPYYGTYIDDNGITLTISADSIVYDGYTYKLKSFKDNIIVIVDINSPSYICTLEIETNGLYHSENQTHLVKQESLDPLAAYYGNYEYQDPTNPLAVVTISIDETGFNYSVGGPASEGTASVDESGVITVTFEDGTDPLVLTPTMDGNICTSLTDSSDRVFNKTLA